MKSVESIHQKLLLIGPLPPPWGGATVSFRLFYDCIKKHSKADIKHYDLPVRFSRDKNPRGTVNWFMTLGVLFLCLFDMPFASNIIVFGSRNFCFTYGLLLLVLSKLFRKPFHLRFFGGHPAQAISSLIPLIRTALFKLLGAADQIVVQTLVGAQEFPPYLKHKITVVVGYRSFLADILPKTKSPEDSIRFVYVGAITRAKGVHLLLAGFKALRDSARMSSKPELHLYGAGPKEMVGQLQEEEAIYYHGEVDNTAIRSFLSTYDVFVFPSVYINEGHPGVLVEALMAGLPVITSDLPGPREVIRDGINGILFSAGDIKQLTGAMSKLVENDALRKRLSEGALVSSRNFNAEFVLPKLAAAFGISV